MPYDVGIFDAPTGGTRYTPPQLVFVAPAAPDEVQTITVWIQNLGADTVPAGAFLMMKGPWEAPAGVDEFKWRRNQELNVEGTVTFSIDGGTTWHSRAWFPALPQNGTRQEVIVRWIAPPDMGDLRRGPEIDVTQFPVPGRPDDWPPIVGLEVAIRCRPFLLDSFAHWQISDPTDNYLIASKWDKIWLEAGTTEPWIDPVGGPRGGKCYYVHHKDDAIWCQGEANRFNRQELVNINAWTWHVPGMVIGARVQLGEGEQFTENGVHVMSMWPTGNLNYPIYFYMGENGALRCVAWANIGGVTGNHELFTLTPTWGPEDWVYLELAMKCDPAGSRFIEAAFAVEGTTVWSGTLDTNTPREGVKMGELGSFEWGYFPFPHPEPYYIRLRYADAYVGEAAGPIDSCFLGPIEVHHSAPTGDGGYADWTKRFPASPANDLYTYVDEPEWDERLGTWIAPVSVAVGDHYEFHDPKTTFTWDSALPASEVVAVQPYVIAGSFLTTTGANTNGDYDYTTYIKSGPNERVLNPNATSAGPWQIDYLTMVRNPWTGQPWTYSEVNALEFGVAVTSEWDMDYGAGTEVLAATQVGMEVAIRLAAPPVTHAFGTIVGC